MASTISHAVVFETQTAYPLPSQKFMIPAAWKRYQLSQLINKALSLPNPIPFDFLVRGQLLRTGLGDWCAENGVGEEETLQIEYIESVMPPQRMSELPHEDWVSSVSCKIPNHFLTASYDGSIRLFDYSQKLASSTLLHYAAITSICVVPSSDTSYLIGSASHDLTAQLTRLSIEEGTGTSNAQALASLHLHTAPLTSITTNTSGSKLLTTSWDGLIGLWDTSIPSKDELPALVIADRKKRRKIAGGEGAPKRKAPISVLKSHTARISKAVFSADDMSAYSAGFDSTVRSWDVENGVCTATITAPEKPFLDMALTPDGHTILAASTDRTVSLFDLRESTAATTAYGSLMHYATPSCIAVPETASSQQIITGAYDGVVRLWDLRSMNSSIASFQAWEAEVKKSGKKKVLGVDWHSASGVVGVAGEGGLEVWKVGNQN